MDDYTLPQIYTVQEIADYLKVERSIVLQEMETGNLKGFKVGREWRSSAEDLLSYVRGERPGPKSSDPMPVMKPPARERGWAFVETGPLTFNWPKKGGGGKPEEYDRGVEATAKIRGQEYTFKIGFGSRDSAGQVRRRVTIWLGHRALVEFAGSNDFENDGLLAGVIRLKNGKQLTTQRIPDEYERFKIDRFNRVVQGPRASTAMAVVVHKDDLSSMLEHAVIRATWKDII